MAFSCKRRGFFPSCGARRLAENAALLVDDILPPHPIRQWVLSFPFALRYRFATRPAKLRQVLAIVYRVIARHYAGAAGVAVSQGHPGPVADRRISLTPNGNIRYALKTPYRDGTTHVVPDPMGLVAPLRR
ncbi:MAG: hypothetical protein AAF736_03415 [Pseudomonadota bacterium]